ncbi:16873_t:CDS:2 [Funneliformis geosporum]|uniref:10581_t:CDS:1 n=1 Tax=Funneliformis geosporum TaxID=1117311 RepID=A0A9W4SN58_9GLOM|nr:10581_t:CDS:2 [Funneliformis geosporum]CAI2186814.1 16873_t:CDS:2 [Funneliformis geosporum]
MSTQRIFLPLPLKYQTNSFNNKNDNIFSYTEDLINFCKKYSSLAEAHIVDFFTDNTWEIIPKEWRDVFEVECENIIGENNYGNNNESNFVNKMIRLASFHEYESLKKYIRDTKELVLSRDISIDVLQMECENSIDKRILPGMNKKKLHEVKILSNLIASLANENKISSIIDLGAGQGYLSRVLAYTHNLCVFAIDASNVQTCGAQKYQFRTEKSLGLLRKDKNEVEREENIKSGKFERKRNGCLNHITQYVTSETLSSLITDWNKSSNKHIEVNEDTGYVKIIEKAKDVKEKNLIDDDPCSNKQVEQDDDDYLICGLHSCGQLSSSMLDLFIKNEKIKSVANVGYKKCSFPLSKVFKEKKFYMGSTIRQLACQVPSRWSSQQESSINAFEHHFYRALLQYILTKKELIKDTPRIGKLRRRDFASFSAYCTAALKKLSLPLNCITQVESEQYYNEYKINGFMHKIIIFCTLRALLGPCFESIILLDKCLYLFENNIVREIKCFGVFDEIKSPRNMVIVGLK